MTTEIQQVSAHTPGPLFLKQEDKWPFDLVTVDAEGNEVFSERRFAYGSNQETVKQVLAGSCFDKQEDRARAVSVNAQQVADALLRAAAPELLTALQRAQKWIGDQMEDAGWPRERINNPPAGSHLEAISAAIAKATGSAA